jgi:hypothetical protein
MDKKLLYSKPTLKIYGNLKDITLDVPPTGKAQPGSTDNYGDYTSSF